MATTSPIQPADTTGSGTRRHDRGRLAEAGMVPALVLIAVGGILLLQNFGRLPGWGNWWALFILIPAFGSFAAAWGAYSANGRRLGGDVARTFMTGLLLLAVTIIFLLELDWGKVWPVLLVIVGIGLLLGWKRH